MEWRKHEIIHWLTHRRGLYWERTQYCNTHTHTHTHTGECGGKHVEEDCWSRTQHKTSIASVAVTFPFARPIHTVDVFTKETHSASHCAVVSNQTHLVFRFSFEKKNKKQNKTIQKASMAIQVGTTKTIKSMLVYVIETIKIDVDRSSWVGIALGGATRNLETRFSIFSCSVWSWWIAFTVVVVVVVVVWNGWSNRIKSGVTFSRVTEEMEREIKKKSRVAGVGGVGRNAAWCNTRCWLSLRGKPKKTKNKRLMCIQTLGPPRAGFGWINDSASTN